MSATHAYFLIDASALGSSAAITRVVTRILVYLASKHDAFTWNFELIDLQTRQRALTAHARRRVSERKMVTDSELHAFSQALHGYRRQAGRGKRLALDALQERLMCLEADVEWGDPALMRSPSRTASAMRAWADPTRLNESMSVRSFLYIIGEPPVGLEGVDAFVGPMDGSLVDKLTRLRDGIIGNGIWESYARKRVGVSWLRPSRAHGLTSVSAVDLLIDTVFGCCLEALGGCALSIPELDTAQVPFSFLYGVLHRVRTYPSWSRKFAREISAVVDAFTAPLRLCLANTPGMLRAWSMDTICGSEGGEVRLFELDHSRRQWLTDGRLLRRYTLPEMVALAGDARAAGMRHSTESYACPLLLEQLQLVPLRVWPLAARYVSSTPVFCQAEGLRSEDGFALGRQSDGDNIPAYVAVVPLDSCKVAAVYSLDLATFNQLSAMLAQLPDGRALPADLPVGPAEVFKATWLEDWAPSAGYRLDIEPVDQCSIDMSIDESLIEAFCQAYLTTSASEQPCESVDIPATNGDSGAPIADIAVDDVSVKDTVSTMEAWYAELYIKPIQHPAPTFDRSVAKIASLVDRSADIEGAEAAVLRLTANVLQTSASIGDVFDSGNDDSDDSGTLQDKDSHDFAGIRRQAAALVAGNADGRRSWQLHECQLQILLHLLIIDRIRLWKLDKRIEAGRLTETLSDLVDQLCIWASVDDIFCSAPSGSASTNADNGSSAGDIAAVFIGSSLVGQFTERLGDIVDELRVQCGWVPAADRDDSGQSGELENKRRKGTLRKITASQSERSEVIVQQGKQKPQVMSGRKLARHLEELISSKRRLSRNSNNEPPRPDTGSASERRRSTQLKLPLQLIRQLKNEVVSVRSAPLSRARTINSRSNSSGSMRWGGRNNGTIGATKNSTMNCSRVRAPARRQPIPEFELSSSPSISGRVKEMHLVPETPSKKRQRTGDPVPASSPLFIPSEAPAANAFIYESEDSDVAERSPLFGRTMAGQTCQQPGAGHLQGQGSHRVLRFPDQGH